VAALAVEARRRRRFDVVRWHAGGLVDAAFAPWGSGDRRLAQTLLAVHAALSGARVETDDGDDWQNVVREVRASLLRATRTGKLELAD